MLYIIVSVSFTTFSLALKMCPESIPTVSIVNRCPSNATEWVSAAKRKSCNDLGQLQSCAKADDFVYHCVLNKDATMLLEVCAPTYLMSGYCARFSEVEKRIIIDTGLDCTKFDPPCSTSFMSNESYKYQTCYRNAGENPKGCEASQEKNLHITTAIVISVIFAIIILIILIIIGVGCKLKMIMFARRDEKREHKQRRANDREMEEIEQSTDDKTETNTATPQQGSNEPNDNEAENSTLLNPNDTPAQGDVKEKNIREDNKSCVKEKECIRYRSLSGEKEGEICLKGVKTWSDVRENIAKELGLKRGFIYIVDDTSGTLWNDNKEIKDPPETLSLMIAFYENRWEETPDGDDKNGTNDVGGDTGTSDRRLMRCASNEEMECTHFKDADSWFCWTRKMLLKHREAYLCCPTCYDRLDVEEIVKNCKMTPDEKFFLEIVQNLNSLNENLFVAYQRFDLSN